MTDGADGQSQTAAQRKRRSRDDSVPLGWGHKESSGDSRRVERCPTSEERGPAGEKKEEDEEEEEEEAAFHSPSPEVGRVRGPAGHSQLVAPEGGWGWMVLVATVLVLALTLAFPSCIGIFYTELQTEFQASNTETSWVPAVMTAVLHAGGPLCSALVERFGCRATVMVGGVLSGLGMSVSALARTIDDLYLTSIITGLGFCFSFQPAVTMMGHYFVRRRAFANALSSTGTALGLSTLPLLANFLLSLFGWRGSFLVLGGMLLNCCVCGAVMRPVGPAPAPSRPKLPQNPQKPNNPLVPQEREGFKERLRKGLSASLAFLRRHMAFDLLVSNTRYRAFAMGVSWMMLGFVVPLIYLVPYATDNNMTQDSAAMLMSILGLVSIAVRPLAALLFALPRFRGSGCFIYMFGAAVLVNGLSNAICGASASFEVLLLYVVTFGVSMSVVGSLLFTVLMETVEMSRFPSALGLLSMLESGTLLIGPPLAGWLVDRTGQYSYVFYACTVSVSSSGLFLMGSFYYLDGKREREKKQRTMKTELKKPSVLYQKPVITLLPDADASQASSSSEARKAKDPVHVTSV